MTPLRGVKGAIIIFRKTGQKPRTCEVLVPGKIIFHFFSL